MKTSKVLRKILVSTIALLFLIGAGQAGASSWADGIMESLLNRQIISAIPGNPNEFVTRETYSVMLAKTALTLETGRPVAPNRPEGPSVFEDMDRISGENHLYILYLYDQGILQGALMDGKLYMQPGSLLTRQDAAVLLGRMLGLDTDRDVDPDSRFTDDSDISGYAVNSIYQLARLGIINGFPDGSFRPLNNISFAETSSLVFGVLEGSPTNRPGAQAGLWTYFGSGIIGNADGADFETRFAMPHGVCFDNAGNLLVFDTYNAGVKRIRGNTSETILGFSEILDDHGFAMPQYLDGAMGAALFGRPMAGVSAPNGDLFIVDSENNAIRLLRDGSVYTFAGGVRGFANGRMERARFDFPTAIAIDRAGNLFVADTHNHAIRRITPDGNVTTIAGRAGVPGHSDGSASTALFWEPSGIAVGADGAIYVADTGNHVIRKIERGMVTTIAGAVSDIEPGEEYRPGGYSDSPAASAMFNFPMGLSYVDGVLFIADTGNHAVRALTKSGTVVTLAGSGEAGFADGQPGVSMMNKPTSIAYRNNTLYIADSINNRIRAITINWNILT